MRRGLVSPGLRLHRGWRQCESGGDSTDQKLADFEVACGTSDDL